MLGRDQTRNPVSPEKDAPIHWDAKTGESIKWKAKIGSMTFAAPVVANGLVWIGTNNENPRDPSQPNAAGVLMCFRERDGQFLYQHVSAAREGPAFNQAHTGISCSPLVEGDRLWFVTTRAEVICLDIAPLRRGEGVPKELWKLDMIDELGVVPRRAVMGGGGLCSIGASYRDLIYVVTGNGTDGTGANVPAPLAPALLCLNKNTGQVIWEDNSPGARILFGEWGSPLVMEVGGKGQVIVPQGDGWIRSFDALTGELIWKFDINRKDGKWPMTRGFFSTPPMLYRDRIYIALGNYLEFGEMPGRLCCIDPAKSGDISIELEDGPGKGKPNPNSGAIWHFDGIRRMMGTVAIHDGLLVAPDGAGFVHCLEAATGRTNWMHDMRAQIFASPLIVEQKIYVVDEDGKTCVLALSKEKRLLAEAPLFSEWIASAPIFANGVLYVTAGGTLFAIAEKSDSWPQWRGPDRLNVSRATGLLTEWPTNGPPLLWKATGLGEGIASVSVAHGRLFTLGYRDDVEFAFALDSQSGETIWSVHTGPAIKESALMRWLSQRTPTVDDDRLYAISARGELVCLRTSDGEQLWQKSYANDFLSASRAWGFCDYPLVDGDKLICSPVGREGTVAALNKTTGEIIWKAKVLGDEHAGYAATVATEVGGVRQYVVFLSKSLVGIAADDSRVLWRHERLRPTISSYTPIVQGDNVFSPNGYGGGMVLLKIIRSENGFSAEQQFVSNFNFHAFQDATVLLGDHVYSFQSPGQPVCIEMKTGKLSWGPIDPETKDRAALTCAEGHLYIRRASGRMVLIEATPKQYTEKGFFQIPDREEAHGVTSPVVAERRLYLRDNNRLLCYDIGADAFQKPKPEPKTLSVSLATTHGRSAETTPPRTGRDRAPDAIFVPTPEDIIEQMLEFAKVKKEDLLVALGSGDGRIAIAAAKKYGSHAIGYEIDPRLVSLSREKVQSEKLEALVRIEHEDIFAVDWSNADVIVVYLPAPLMQRLLPQFERLKPGARIVSHQFRIPGAKPAAARQSVSREDGDTHMLFLWTTPFDKTAP